MELTWEEIKRLNMRLLQRSYMFNEYARFSELQFKNWFIIDPQFLWDKELVEKVNDKKYELLKWNKRGKELVKLADWNQFLEWEDNLKNAVPIAVPIIAVNDIRKSSPLLNPESSFRKLIIELIKGIFIGLAILIIWFFISKYIDNQSIKGK